MSNNTVISIICDDCGHSSNAYNQKDVTGYYWLRVGLTRKGWKCTASRDYCSYCAVNGRGKSRQGLYGYVNAEAQEQ